MRRTWTGNLFLGIRDGCNRGEAGDASEQFLIKQIGKSAARARLHSCPLKGDTLKKDFLSKSAALNEIANAIKVQYYVGQRVSSEASF